MQFSVGIWFGMAWRIANRITQELLDCLDVWISLLGRLRCLYHDGRKGFDDAESAQCLEHKGIQKRTQAPRQHCRTAERRGALYRDVIHRMWTR